MREGLLRTWRWQAASLLPGEVGFGRRFSGKRRKRVLILSGPSRILESQIFPFHFYEPELFIRWRHELREVPTDEFERAPDRAPAGADIVCVQTLFDLTPDRCDRLFESIRLCNPDAKIVYLDSFAPTDLRLAAMLDRHIDLYVKKHVFRERSQYFVPTRGDTNLADYYGRLFNLSMPDTYHTIPEGFLNKLVVGPSFCTAPYMLPHFFDHLAPRRLPVQIDVHARLGSGGGGWYQAMRDSAIRTIENLQGVRVASRLGVKPREYRRELRSASLCFSPFGYGEVCWRDYEAALFGTLLLKPDMAHIETEPDIFVPDRTYVPVAWDFNDVGKVVAKWLKNSADREGIARQAYSLLYEYARSARFVDQMAPVFRD